MTIAPSALTGFANASSYDQHRPSYPLEAVDSLLSHLQVKDVTGAKVVDLGAGTGKFTALLAERRENYKILAIEPHEAMRKELKSKGFGSVSVMSGDATSMPLESQSVDALIASQAFHWYTIYSAIYISMLKFKRIRFANDDALKEIHHVLQPGGVFGMIWNIEDYNAPKSWNPSTAWEAKVKAITWRLDDQHPRFRHEQWKKVFEQQLSSTPFTIQAADPLFSLPLGEESVKFTYWMSKDAIWKRYSTLSQIAVLSPAEKESVRKEVFKAMEEDNGEVNKNGEFALHGNTFLAWTTAIPGAPLRNGG